MSNRVFILPYRKGSESIRNLLSSLESVRGIRSENSKYVSKEGDYVINWGNNNPEVDLSRATVLNSPEKISRGSNKLSFFNWMSSVDAESRPNIPEWTQSKQEASQWIENGKTVFARTKLTGHSGEGIVECNSTDDLEAVPNGTLLVKYIPKKEEYRVHFWKGELFDYQRKARTFNVADESVDWRVRSHKNGFVYTRNDLDIPEVVKEQAEKCMVASTLDFGAIDIIWNKWYNKAYCLEINTAPGLQETTLWNYVGKITSWMGEIG